MLASYPTTADCTRQTTHAVAGLGSAFVCGLGMSWQGEAGKPEILRNTEGMRV